MGCLLSKKDKPKSVSDNKLRVDIKPVIYDVDVGMLSGGDDYGVKSPCKDNKSVGNTGTTQEKKQQQQQKYKGKCDTKISAKYEIKALIGKGTFSRVVRVEHRVTKQPYAMKVIDCRRGRELFDAELSTLRRVRHPNVIQLIEVLETPNRIYLVMELATGGDLFDRIVSRGFFTEREAIRVLKMVLDGVRYLHGLGITHRDLKPDNLLYYHPGNDSRLMITDFGLACTRRSGGGNSFMYTACGTPEYISPEIVTRRPYTSAVDLWAIGVIAYILLAGTFPFDDDNTTRLYKKILRASYSFSGEVSQYSLLFNLRLMFHLFSLRLFPPTWGRQTKISSIPIFLFED